MLGEEKGSARFNEYLLNHIKKRVSQIDYGKNRGGLKDNKAKSHCNFSNEIEKPRLTRFVVKLPCKLMKRLRGLQEKQPGFM